jgi:hypothetical protein
VKSLAAAISNYAEIEEELASFMETSRRVDRPFPEPGKVSALAEHPNEASSALGSAGG